MAEPEPELEPEPAGDPVPIHAESVHQMAPSTTMAQQEQADTAAASTEPETAEPAIWEPAASASDAPLQQGQASATEAPAESLHATATWEASSEWEAPPAAQPADLSGMPEEQPFERGGRWWFKRGQELLVYEEQTAQWVPAPATEIPAAEPEPEPEPAGPATQSGFWRCPSCGAVNGSTAATCRMCFAARP